MRRVTVLGSTGSVGEQALQVIAEHSDRLQVHGLTARGNHARLLEQIREFSPAVVALRDEDAAENIYRAARECGVEVLAGEEGVCRAASDDGADVIISAISGFAGLRPTLAACRVGAVLGLANKESVVCAGSVLMREVQRTGTTLVPVDSEHNALYQCLQGEKSDEVARLILTASGGPFWDTPAEELRDVTPERALAHPRWDMGRKISIDSATLMNKGLEVIEAHWLFDFPLAGIDVVVHPQSAVHALVRFVDGSVKAHAGPTDMRYPVQHALSYDARWEDPGYTDFSLVGSEWRFEAPDEVRFPCLRLARKAAGWGGMYPTVLVSADEVAVESFLRGRIAFLDIPAVIERALDELPLDYRTVREPGLDEIVAVDEWTRDHVHGVIMDM